MYERAMLIDFFFEDVSDLFGGSWNVDAACQRHARRDKIKFTIPVEIEFTYIHVCEQAVLCPSIFSWI